MSTALILILAAACGLLLFIERRGAPLTLKLNFKGDIKRETRWLAQYGQAMSTVVAGLLVVQLDSKRAMAAIPLATAPLVAGLLGAVIKRLLGRVRPGHEGAGHFLGPTLRHANWRESFPSNHSASAIAFTVVAAALYPPAAAIFWGLGLCCAALRYIMDAHWPSDVVAGVLFGYAIGHWTVEVFTRLAIMA